MLPDFPAATSTAESFSTNDRLSFVVAHTAASLASVSIADEMMRLTAAAFESLPTASVRQKPVGAKRPPMDNGARRRLPTRSAPSHAASIELAVEEKTSADETAEDFGETDADLETEVEGDEPLDFVDRHVDRDSGADAPDLDMDDETPTRRRRGRPRKGDSAVAANDAMGGASALGRYFVDISHQPKHEKGAEFEAVSALRAAEAEAWRVLASRPQSLAAVVAAAREALSSTAAPDADRLARAASRSAAQIDAAVRRICAADIHRDAIRAAAAAACGAASGRGGAAWLRSVRRAMGAVTRLKDGFVAANLRLAISVARSFSKRKTIPLEDLIQEANLGLIRAVDGYDPDRGFRFSTYATWWIRQYVRRSFDDHARTVRVPVHVLDASRRIWSAKGKLRQELGRDPTDSEIAVTADLAEKKVSDVARLALGATNLSLDAPAPGIAARDDDAPPMELPDTGTRADELLGKAQEERWLVEILDEMPARYSSILRMRHGIGGAEPMTLEQIGNTMDRTRERVRQIEMKALSELRKALVRRGFGAPASGRPRRVRAKEPETDGGTTVIGEAGYRGGASVAA